jgi:methylphosphotriester-DNA--protein-cysteine methyltransferase
MVAVVVVSLAFALDYEYVGSKNSDKYHYPTCKLVRKIKPADLVTFKTAREALVAGYVPCRVCRPLLND